MTDRLQGKIAIITGGSRGIGAAMARAFAAAGGKVVIASRKQDALDAVAAEINADYPDSVVARAAHVGYPDKCRELVEWVSDEVGLPNVLVNNAGTNPYFGPMLGAEYGAWDKTFDVNVKSAFELTRQVAQLLIQAGEGGSIINVSSVFGMTAAPMQGIYGMSKAAMISMTKTFAFELGGARIRVNAIAPGLVDTRLAAAIVHNDDLAARFTDRSAENRYAQPEEIAGLVVYLASDESSFVTGQTIPIDGGYTSY